MFGYALADILLNDFKLVFYLGLAISLFSIYYLKKSIRVVYVLLAACWLFPGYYFFIREFEPIYWPLGHPTRWQPLQPCRSILFQKGWLARTVSAVSMLWCLAAAIVLWALVYEV